MKSQNCRKNREKDINLEQEEKVQEDDKEPTIMKGELEKAVKDMKRGKATGDYNIPVDLLKELGEN